MSGVRNSRLLLAGSVLSHSDNRWVSGFGLSASPKSPSATSDTRWALSAIAGG
ncbi:hypothetical protein J7K19_08830 [bacterium]|nr:hypothetical protein [bacterium]